MTEKPENNAPDPTYSPVPPGELSVLVVDNEKHIRGLVVKSLLARDIKAEEAVNGQEGLQKLFRSDYNVLVVDIRMSIMDGITFLREALNIWPWLGVVVITGYKNEENESELHRLGVERIIEKPFDVQALIEEIIAEYNLQKNAGKNDQMVPLSNIQRQLQVLRQITDSVLEETTFPEALRRLTSELAYYFNVSAAGLLDVEGEPLAVFNLSESISNDFLNLLLKESKEKYFALSGKQLNQDIRTEVEGEGEVGNGPQKPAERFYVPIISGTDIGGLLILASTKESEYDATGLSFIYHACNHLSLIFSALRRSRRLAITDSLTDAYNRLYLQEQLDNIWEDVKRYDRNLSVVMIDIDYFKNFNDTLGHIVGDKVLKEFAGILKNEARAADIVGRYGGDEFVTLMPQTTGDAAMTFAERLSAVIREHIFCQGKHDIHLTASIGICSNNDLEEPETKDAQLLEDADKALYLAKKEGRNCVRRWPNRNNN